MAGMDDLSANNRQVGGLHYATKLQHWDYVADRQLGYFEGQITKYVTRWRKKNGIQDLEKAQHFLAKLYELANAGRWLSQQERTWSSGAPQDIPCDMYLDANDVRAPLERSFIALVSTWAGMSDLGLAQEQIATIIETARAEAGRPE